MLPFYAVLLCLMVEMDFRKALSQTRWLWLTLALYILFRSVYVPLSHSLFYSISIDGLTWDQSLANIIQLLTWYLSKLVIPVNIFLMWSQPFIRQGSFDWLTGGIIFAGLLFIGLRYLWGIQRKTVLFLLWFFIGLLPVCLGAFATPFMGALLEPHWFIPAIIGFFAATVLLLDHYVRGALAQKIILVVITLTLMCCAWSNNSLWSNEINFYKQWAAENPQFKAVHYFLGTVYKRDGQFEKARGEFQQSFAGRYKDWIVYLNLAQLDIAEHHLDEARMYAHKALDLEPRHTDIFNTFGAIECAQRHWDEAKIWFGKAIDSNPFNLEPRMNLALVYRAMNEPPKAIEEYQEILHISPGFMPAQTAMARLTQNQ